MHSENWDRVVSYISTLRTHYFDHVIPMSQILGIKTLFASEADASLAAKFYQNLDFALIKPENVIDTLSENYEAFITSDLYGKKLRYTIRHIFCPHGFSDKAAYMARIGFEDLAFVYGKNMYDIFTEFQVLDKIKKYSIRTGNYRYAYYRQHQQFYDRLAVDEIANYIDPTQKTILYAPTWLDYEEGSTFFTYFETLIEHLPQHFNLIVKPHPSLRIYQTEMYEKLIWLHNKKRNVLFLHDFTPIYPIVNFADIYLGDSSSVGYDFLTFNKPMFFFNKFERNPEIDPRLYLTRCGKIINPSDLNHLFQIIEKGIEEDTHFHDIRKRVYHYTFGEERSPEQIKSDLKIALQEI